MDTKEQINSVNNSSTLGDISILTPSQRREQERLRKEQEDKEAAKKRKREEAKLAKEREKQAKKSFYIIIMIVSIVCALGWTIFGALQEYNFVLGVIVGLILAIPAMYAGAALADNK